MNNMICTVKHGDLVKYMNQFEDMGDAIKYIEDVTEFIFPKDLVERGQLVALTACAEKLSEMGISVSFAKKEPETDKDKLLGILENYDDTLSFEQMMLLFLDVHNKEFSAYRIHKIIRELNDILVHKIDLLEACKATAKERATYLKSYLEGAMYTTKEAAEKHVNLQINHAQAIINACSDINPLTGENSMKL